MDGIFNLLVLGLRDVLDELDVVGPERHRRRRFSSQTFNARL